MDFKKNYEGDFEITDTSDKKHMEFPQTGVQTDCSSLCSRKPLNPDVVVSVVGEFYENTKMTFQKNGRCLVIDCFLSRVLQSSAQAT